MHLKDRRGLEVSTRNTRSLDRFERALDLTTSYFVDPLAEINAAIADDPGCAIAHCLRAGLAVMSSERGALPLIEESVAVIEAPATGANDRERRHAAAARTWAQGDFAARQADVRRHRRRLPARPARGADRARRRLLPRPVDHAARPHGAGAAALGRERARLRLPARHARVRAGGDGALRARRGHRPPGTRAQSRATRGPCTPSPTSWRCRDGSATASTG